MSPIKAKYKRLRSLFISLAFLAFFGASGQNNQNYLQVTTTSTNFNLSSAAALETTQVLSKAIQLGINSRNNSYSVYVRVTNVSYPSGSSLDDFILGIRLNSVSISGTPSPNYNTVYLSLNDQRIAQGTRTNGVGYWYYDLTLAPLGYNTMPGNYMATILFTMTQP